ncbi:Cof-type HAD-IIB family hydrolase [Neobacillus sp. Marseille-QA0830]
MKTNHINGKKIKLVALDMDGTLLNSNHQISNENQLAIQEAQNQGIIVVLSTGRSINTCREHADALGLNSYLVTVNGSEIWDENRELFRRELLTPEQIEWMYQLSRQFNTGFWAISTEQTWHDEMPEDLHNMEWMKFGFNIEDETIRETVFQQLQTRGEFELTNSFVHNIEINPVGISKAKGLEIVCGRLGIKMENVMAVGDSLNDLAMIKEAGLGVAMGNAQEKVKQAADWVTKTNDENGVAFAIRTWILAENGE